MDDAALLAALGARTFEDSFGPENRPEDMERYLRSSFSRNQIRTELADPASTFLLAYQAGRPVGYAKLSDSKQPDCVRGPKPLELVRLYVEQDLTGKGYGSALMKACLDEAQRAGHRTIWLGVWVKNELAIRFYEDWGFTKVGAQEFVLGSAVQNDFVMERPVELAA